MPRLDPTSLRLFVAVVETGTIAGAAAREHIAAAAVSRRLADIEAVLGVALFERTNRGVRPTAAGQALVGLARRAIAELDQVSVQMRGFSGALRGLVRVSASLSAITQFVPADLESFVNAHPDIQVRLQEQVSTAVSQAVLENAADIGIYTSAAPERGLQTFAYRCDQLVAVVPRGHCLARRRSVSLQEVLAHPIIGLHSGSAIDQMIARAAGDAQRPVNLRVQVTGFEALCLMVSHRLGIGVLPQAVAQRNARTLDLVAIPLRDPAAQRRFSVCVRSVQSLTPAARALLEHLVESARQA